MFTAQSWVRLRPRPRGCRYSGLPFGRKFAQIAIHDCTHGRAGIGQAITWQINDFLCLPRTEQGGGKLGSVA